ncbi:uncharacterized protein LOC129582836 [Paramacrobiotus metropolitanus]|uniref:uncharacterized protein LOC129582836 n=1 Tax=Paramacrobiotus metropolitanus TaxID=2943436 RepID=UPI002445E156|nr:uncharacterized protein LOC129582836 [Paramacrobiotus metropolitanus]
MGTWDLPKPLVWALVRMDGITMCTLTGQTYRFNPTTNAWEFSNSGRCLQVNAMSKNTAVEIQRPSALDSNDGDIRKYNGAGLIPTWTLVAGSNQRVFQYSKWVSIGEDGEIWTISRKGNVFRYNGASNNFDGIPILSAIALDVRNATYATVVTAGCNAWTFKSGTWTKWAISTCPVQTTSTSSNDYYLDEHGRFGSRH